MAKLRARHRSRRIFYRARLRYWSDRRFERPRHPMADTLLLVDDDASVLRAIGEYFERIGYEVWRESPGGEAVDTFQRVRPDVVLLDLHLPDSNGLVVLERLRRDGAAVVLLTGQGDIETAVRAMQLGAENFLTKPVDMSHLAAAIARLTEKVRLTRQNARLRALDHEGESAGSLGVSPAMHELARQVELLAASERSTVLLQGESGTGKELVARAVHKRSRRASGAFIRVNCAAIPPSLVASELFGHEKGAFTGAVQRRLGRFEAADGGTIFLDEIGELPPEAQVSLLRVLQEREIERVGSSHPI